MSQILFNVTPIYGDASSKTTDGATVTAGGATMALGGAAGANGVHAMLRFDVYAQGITKAYTVVEAYFKVNASASNTPTDAFNLRSSEFGAAITIADYNQAANRVEADGALRALIDELIPADALVSVDQEFSLYVPSQYLRGRDNTSGEPYADFEIVPAVTGVPAVGHTVTLHGVTAATAALKPRIVGYAVDNVTLADDPTFACIATTDEQVAAFGLQEEKDDIVKPTVLFQVIDADLQIGAGNIVSEAASKSRSKPGRTAPGGIGAGGSIMFELTPERWTKILLSWFYLYSQSSAVVDGDTIYTKVFRVRDACSVPYWTFFVQKGFQRKLFPNMRVSTLSISDSGTMKGELGTVGTTGYIYDKFAAGEDERYLLASDAAADSEDHDLMSFMSVRLDFENGELPGEDVDNFGLTIAQAISAKRGYNGQREVSNTFAGAFTAAISYTTYFKNNTMMRKYFGVDHNDFPYSPEKKVIKFGCVYSLVGGLGAAKQFLSFNMPTCSMQGIRESSDGDSALTLQCTAVALDDASIGGSMEVTQKDSYDASVFLVAETEKVTVLPIERAD